MKDLVSWTTMVVTLGGKRSLEPFRRMEQEGLEPDTTSLLSVLGACSHEGMLEQGCCFFRSMESDYGITPRQEHYCCLIDILGKSGHTERAEALIQAMPWLADGASWGAFLGACRLHSRVTQGIRAARGLHEVDYDDPASHLLVMDMILHSKN
ncbi:hypothetical protein SELMODRAFT_83862 [Selaginella moellendorffii]|uniref:Pentacotripeptide-repeat region of PRORP domain-containing protein n=2 Tax=Selaginella moellendorffii TaxID=88036 RepID=D8R2W9_SELML|nr:hypothetical protein SELMODRAFT_83862 [Selaginella moellendorffii]